MHEHITSYKQNPTQNFHKKLINIQKPQKFHKNPKPRSKCMKCIKNERLEKLTRGKKQGLGRNPSGEDEWVKEKCLGEKKKCFCREKSVNARP